jgi:hypothetical protein
MAGRVADGEEDRLVRAGSLLERLVSPRVPGDRIVGVLAEIRALLPDQPVGRSAGHAAILSDRRRQVE